MCLYCSTLYLYVWYIDLLSIQHQKMLGHSHFSSVSPMNPGFLHEQTLAELSVQNTLQNIRLNRRVFILGGNLHLYKAQNDLIIRGRNEHFVSVQVQRNRGKIKRVPPFFAKPGSQKNKSALNVYIKVHCMRIEAQLYLNSLEFAVFIQDCNFWRQSVKRALICVIRLLLPGIH